MTVPGDSPPNRITTHSYRVQVATCCALILLALAASGYLVHEQHQLTIEAVRSGPDFCSAIFGKGCSAALGSSMSTRFGLSLAGWGYIYYSVLGALLLTAPIRKNQFLPGGFSVAMLLSFLATMVSLILLLMMVRHPELLCPVCIFLHAINVSLFFLVNSLDGNRVGRVLKQALHAGKDVSRNIRSNPVAGRQAAGYGMLLLFAGGLYVLLRVYAHSSPASPYGAFDEQQSIKAFYAQPRNSIPVDEDDPVWGDRHTRVEMIVFSDFECPACRYFFQVLQDLEKECAGKYHVVFKPFPLGLDCNATIHSDIHPKACEAAWAAEAAGEQGKFWPFHDALFTTGLKEPGKTVCSIAIGLGLDLPRFEQARSGSAVLKKVQRSIEQATALGVSSTPAIFINGRRAADMRLPFIRTMVQHEAALP